MLIALKKAFFDVFKSNIRGLLWATVFITVLLFGLLFFGFSELARYWQIKDMPSVSIIINAVGVLAFFVLALFLFPAVATFVAGFFMDTAVERLEAEHKNLPLRTVPLSESIKMSGVAMTKSVLTSSFLVPISFIPIFTLITPILFYYLNGRLFARETEQVWICTNCGHIHIGTHAPAKCPVCDHPQGYFVLRAENH